MVRGVGMRLSSIFRMTWVMGIASVALLPAFARAQTSVEVANTLPADLKPIELRFKTAGIIAKVNVKEGDVVKADQILFEQDDKEERDELDILKLDATDIRVQAQKKNEEVKRAEYDKIKQIHDTGAQN